MAYDEQLAGRIRTLITDEPGLAERKMFGGLAFLIGGHMAVAVSHQGGLLLPVDADRAEAMRAEPHATAMVMRGREIDGWLRVAPEGVATDAQLERWVSRGVAYAKSRPPSGR